MDNLSRLDRARTMASIRSKGNRSTEWRMRSALMRAHIKEWVMHPPSIAGKPDFYFHLERVAVFIDGCFWHRCPICLMPIPQTNELYWLNKLRRNVERDNEVVSKLEAGGIRCLRIWEHELRNPVFLGRLIDWLKELTSGYAR